MNDFLFRGSLYELDPAVDNLIQFEAERQFRRLILVASESSVPQAVREALSGAFHNIYAEGYPPEASRWLTEEEILDYDVRLSEYRRYSDPRYYKGVEYADIIESLARRRCAETFATDRHTADDLFVNVQALSGGPANNAVYHALLKPGDTVMGMDLIHGGHLSHGSPVNRSGKFYKIVSYAVNPETERIDYDEMRELALEHKPKMIIGGFSSYPWVADWAKYREIADEVGAYFLADIAHVAGLVAGGQHPSPVDYADVITTTTHKTLNGPRGAIIITPHQSLAKKLDRAVFPGEQGGPHVNVFAAMAVAFKIAQTDQFASLQKQIVRNCQALTKRLAERGFRIPFGGTNTHLMNLDCKSVQASDGTPLNGDMAARILDIAGIVVNRNTIPGDRSALNPSGLRIGTPWITQRGLREAECTQLADIIADILLGCTPYRVKSSKRGEQRAKVDFSILNIARKKVSVLAEQAGIDYKPTNTGYPHFPHRVTVPDDILEWAIFELDGPKVHQFVNFVFSSDLESLKNRDSQLTTIQVADETFNGVIGKNNKGGYYLRVEARHANLIGSWLRDLSDGYISFEKEDRLRKIPGPVSIKNAGHGIGESIKVPDPVNKTHPEVPQKPYFIGQPFSDGETNTFPEFFWEEPEKQPLLHTPLFQSHVNLGAKMVPFSGWEMPVWYSSVKEEHKAVRNNAGLFDVSHMGVYQVEGPYGCTFLDSVCSNDISALNIGQSCYTHFLDPDANVIDDLLVYRRSTEKYLIVVNASNDNKDWKWLNLVKSGQVKVDNQRPSARAFGRHAILRNLRDKTEGGDKLVDLAIQGPYSREILLALDTNPESQNQIKKLKRTELCEINLGGFDLLVSRTGYTGEGIAFELFVHPDQAPALWNTLLEIGTPLGLTPCGLGARDSLRTEAGLPLYGQEMGGSLNLGVGEAGFASYVKLYKPWFIGRDAFISQESNRTREVIRFTFDEQNVRMAHHGDPVLDRRGRTIGVVTSCAIDSQGYLTGQAVVDNKYTVEGTQIFVYQGASQKPEKAPADLRPGDRVTIPMQASVVKRFPRL